MPAYASCSRLGGVASQSNLATLAGLEILREGGNAFDASIAVSSVLTVLLPHTSSVGGDGFLLAVDSGGSIVAYNGSGRSPRDFPAERFIEERPERGPLTVTVPGLVDMWEWISDNYCSMDMRTLLRRAITLAMNGFHVQEQLAAAVDSSRGILARYASWRRVFGGLGEGNLARFPRLARIYSQIAARGADAFYRSKLTEEIVGELEREGVPISCCDFEEHRGTAVKPLVSSFRDFELYELPPNTQGVTTLQLLKFMEVAGLDERAFEEPARVLEFFRLAALAYEDRDRFVADPEYYEAPVEEMLSADRLKSRLAAGTQPVECKDGDTTFFVVADRYGNMVGFIQSVFHSFGSGIVACEIPFQSRAAGFAKRAGHPNSPAPRKRPLHTLSILLARHDERGEYIIGCAGGDYRPQIHAQVLVNIAGYGMPLSAAVDAPRAILESWGEKPRAVVEGELHSEGMPGWVRRTGSRSPATGIVHSLRRDSRGVTYFVADPRGGGLAAPLM